MGSDGDAAVPGACPDPPHVLDEWFRRALDAMSDQVAIGEAIRDPSGGIVDFDVVDESNLQRQVLHGTPDVGRAKVASTAGPSAWPSAPVPATVSTRAPEASSTTRRISRLPVSAT